MLKATDTGPIGSKQRPSAFRRADRGFTLLEVLTTVVILSIAMLGMVSMQFVTIRTNEHGGKLTAATNLAESKLSELRAMQYYLDISVEPPVLYQDNNLASGNDEIDALGNRKNDNNRANPPFFKRSWTVVDVGDQHSFGASKTLEIKMEWDDPSAGHSGVLQFEDVLKTIRFQ